MFVSIRYGGALHASRAGIVDGQMITQKGDLLTRRTYDIKTAETLHEFLNDLVAESVIAKTRVWGRSQSMAMHSSLILL